MVKPREIYKLDNIIRRLKSHATAINKILEDAKKIWPEANLYLDGTGNLNLMSGAAHEGALAEARYDRVLDSVKLNADGGDW